MEAVRDHDQDTPAPQRWQLWLGRVLTAVPILLMTMSAMMKVTHNPKVVEGMVGKLGWPESAAGILAALELACVVLYAIPATATLGAVLMTGYLGGAVATHLRVNDMTSVPMPFLLGVVAWAGLYLRDRRLHALLPLRRGYRSP